MLYVLIILASSFETKYTVLNGRNVSWKDIMETMLYLSIHKELAWPFFARKIYCTQNITSPRQPPLWKKGQQSWHIIKQQTINQTHDHNLSTSYCEEYA